MLNILKDIDYIIPDENETPMFLPKPFVLENIVSKVYLPGQTYYIPFMDGLPLDKIPMYMCVHTCKQFLNYPTIKWGIRCIPKDAECCQFGGRCRGAHLMLFGKKTGRSIDIKDVFVNGLTRTQKTR